MLVTWSLLLIEQEQDETLAGGCRITRENAEERRRVGGGAGKFAEKVKVRIGERDGHRDIFGAERQAGPEQAAKQESGGTGLRGLGRIKIEGRGSGLGGLGKQQKRVTAFA